MKKILGLLMLFIMLLMMTPTAVLAQSDEIRWENMLSAVAEMEYEDTLTATEPTYIIHRTNGTVHRPNCASVKRMNEENKVYYYGSYEELMASAQYSGQYVPCKNCTPDQAQTHTHSYTSTVIVDPTCTETGLKRYNCSCGESYTETISAKGHVRETVFGKPATCITDGLTDGTKCTICGATLTEQRVIPAAGHQYTAVVTAPGYVTQGYTTHSCQGCGDCYVDSYTDALCDLNGDYTVDAADLTILLRHVAKIEVITDEDLLLQLDLDNDGRTNAADVTLMARYLAGEAS